MSEVKNTFRAVAAPALVAAVGGLALVAVLAPSPVRLDLWYDVRIASPELRFPEASPTIPKTALNEMVDRPLFNADRKKDPPQPSQNNLPGLDTYRLAGVIVAGTTSVAFVERKQAKTNVTLRVGDSLDGRTVTAITADGITFSTAVGSEVLSVPRVYGASISPHGTNGAHEETEKLKSKVGGKDHS